MQILTLGTRKLCVRSILSVFYRLAMTPYRLLFMLHLMSGPYRWHLIGPQRRVIRYSRLPLTLFKTVVSLGKEEMRVLTSVVLDVSQYRCCTMRPSPEVN